MNRRNFLGRTSLALGAAAGAPAATTAPRAVAPHADALTNAGGYEYWMVGNGLITAALQTVQSAEGGTHCGLLLSSPEHFCRKPASYLYHERNGLEGTRPAVFIDGKTYFPEPSGSRIDWEYPDGIPTVRIEWQAADCAITERLWCASDERVVIREIALRTGGKPHRELLILAPFISNRLYFDEYEEDAAAGVIAASGYRRLELFGLTQAKLGYRRLEFAASDAVVMWSIDHPAARVREKGLDKLRAETAAWWRSKGALTSNHAGLNHLFRQAQKGMRCAVARNGKMDGGPMQYNSEWVRDSVMVGCGATLAGMPEVGEAILERNLRRAVGEDGRTAEASSHRPDSIIELDQNGELLHALRLHWLWTGDDRLIRQYWPRIQKVADFVLGSAFGFPETGLVKNLREFWERSPGFGVREGYELAYQVWNVVGLEQAAEMALHKKDPDAAARWQQASQRMKQALLAHPKFALVEGGRFIKRRLATGEPQFLMEPPDRSILAEGMPLRFERVSYCDPDTTMALPVMLGLVDPSGDLARNTMASIEKLWNQRWSGGGYGRYDVTSEPDSPGPWPFATLFVMRAYAEMGDWDKVWRGVHWLLNVQGARAGTWLEFYGERPSPPLIPVSYIPWNWAEMMMFLVSHLLGVEPALTDVRIRPRLMPGVDKMDARLRLNGHILTLRVARDKGTPLPADGLRIARPTADVTVEVRCA
jgi:hypothetical protein